MEKKAKNNVKRNALLESLLIHARNIFYFLFNEYNNKQPDDVLVLNHFNYSKEWDTFKKFQLEKDIFVDLKKRIAKEIAHLSFARIKKAEENNNWDIRFEIDLIEGIDKFIEYVPKNLLDDDWKNSQSIRSKIFSDENNLFFKKYFYSTH